MAANRQDFTAVAALLTGGSPADITLGDMTKDTMRAALAAYAYTHEPASIRRAWSTWTCCASSCIPPSSSEPIRCRSSGVPSRPKPSPAACPGPRSVRCSTRLTATASRPGATTGPKRDLALILTALLAGLRLDELRRADVGDIRTGADDGAVIHVRGKGGKERSVPIEADLLAVIEHYLDSRAVRFPAAARSSLVRHSLSRCPFNAALFVGRGGQRITRGTIQSRVRRAFRRAGTRRAARARRAGARAATHLRHRARVPTSTSACTP